MKLLRLKITDDNGFRGLPSGFEYHFRSEATLQEEADRLDAGFEPFVCAGRNGSGKSNLLEAIAAIFFHLECLYLENLPDSFRYDLRENPNGFRGEHATPDGFEIEYLIRPKDDRQFIGYGGLARVTISKEPGHSPELYLYNKAEEGEPMPTVLRGSAVRDFLPEYVLGYSSGENEILSLPFFKLRFVQYDEHWQALRQQLPYEGRPESRMAYLDDGFSQAILLCNLLLQDETTLQPFREDVGIDELKEFRIILRRSIIVSTEVAETFGPDHPAIETDPDTGVHRINLMHLLEAGPSSAANFAPIVTRLKRCATLSFVDEITDTLILDFWVNAWTQEAFRENFDYTIEQSPVVLFQALQVLLTLNLYSVSDALKADLYCSDSHYVGETVPTLASDERIMRFKNFYFTKRGLGKKKLLLKSLSDGEHQLLHSLGLCLLFRNTNSLFLLDEPETHFNPDWRASFISRLRQCLPTESGTAQEMLITTHSPFLISDSQQNKVLVFSKDDSGAVTVNNPDYNTLGASINKITLETFDKRETIGERAREVLAEFAAKKNLPDTNLSALATEIQQTIGDSVERTLLIKEILDAAKSRQGVR
jgi:restriction system-associated AAA family ATPase